MTAKVLCIWNSSNSGVWKQSKGLGDVRATEGLRICVVWRRRRETPLSIQFLAIGLGGQMLSGTMMSNSISISGCCFFFFYCVVDHSSHHQKPLQKLPNQNCLVCMLCWRKRRKMSCTTWIWKFGAEEGSAVCSVTAQASHSSRAQVKKWPSEHKLSNLDKPWDFLQDMGHWPR